MAFVLATRSSPRLLTSSITFCCSSACLMRACASSNVAGCVGMILVTTATALRTGVTATACETSPFFSPVRLCSKSLLTPISGSGSPGATFCTMIGGARPRSFATFSGASFFKPASARKRCAPVALLHQPLGFGLHFFFFGAGFGGGIKKNVTPGHAPGGGNFVVIVQVPPPQHGFGGMDGLLDPCLVHDQDSQALF